MSGRYPFTEDRSLTIQSGNIVWNESHDQSTLDYSDAQNNTLSDSISDSYVTAVEDNETQYLSVLETTNDITLDDLHNLTLGNPKMEPQENIVFPSDETLQTENTSEENVNAIDLGGQQVVVFTLDGSDDLFGIQFAQDEDGNIQKYQFKFRTTEDGQLEAIPETVQLLPNDDEAQTENEQLLEINKANSVEKQNEENSPQQTPGDEHVFEESDVNENTEPQNEDHIEEGEEQEQLEVFIKGERHSPVPQTQSSDEQEYYDEQDDTLEQEQHEDSLHEQADYAEEETIDTKTGILEESLKLRIKPHTSAVTKSEIIKQELFQEDTQHSIDQEFSEEVEYGVFENLENPSEDEHQEEEAQAENLQEENSTSAIIEYQGYSEDVQGELLHHEVEGGEHYEEIREEIYIQESHEEDSNENEEVVYGHHDMHEEEGTQGSREDHFVTEHGNDSDNEEYQIVEGLHITGDIEENSSSAPFNEPQTILQEVVDKPPSAIGKTNILKHTLTRGAKEVRSKKNNDVLFYVIQHPEKENVNSLSGNITSTIPKPVKVNPRSILKSSFSVTSREEDQIKPMLGDDERLNKRFSRSKEAMQAKLLQNFISKTTIAHAPIRQTRLPRKQEIKPVDERRNAEIIVQEVVVSSNGFIETLADKLKNKDKLEITAVVELSDSDDEYYPKAGNKNKKKQRKKKKSELSDTNSEISIIEIPESDEEEPKNEAESPKRGRGRPKKTLEPSPRFNKDKSDTNSLKRRRGRPPKSIYNSDNEPASPSKISRTDSDEPEIDKKEINCPHCTKTFPSQNSLNTHIQHHNLENCIKNKQNLTVRQSTFSKMEYKHKCGECEATFKNSILLKKHVCVKKETAFSCTVCLKKFKTVTALNVHKKSHLKENLVKSTNLVRVSPKKIIPRASTSMFKSPKRPQAKAESTKCKECSKVCSSLSDLTIHSRIHKKFSCSSCSSSFASRLLLDTHVRISCVKSKSPANKRLSFKIKKSFINPPRRSSGKFTPRKSIAGFQLVCDACGLKFSTHRNLYTHKVQKHGLNTPDKSILAKPKKSLYKPRAAHSGIPANDKLKKAYASLREKIALGFDTTQISDK